MLRHAKQEIRTTSHHHHQDHKRIFKMEEFLRIFCDKKQNETNEQILDLIL